MALIMNTDGGIFLLIFLIFFITLAKQDIPIDPGLKYPSANDGRGFGRHFQWLDLEKGMEVAETHQKPIMLIIHKSWCDSCKALKPQFAASKEIFELSGDFIMVNAGDNEEPKDKRFSPDGEYIPRILFLSPNGEVRTEFYNEAGNPSYKYFYADTWSIIASMRKVSQTYKRKVKAPHAEKEL